MDPYDSVQVDEYESTEGFEPDMQMWDCCGTDAWGIGCEQRHGHGEY